MIRNGRISKVGLLLLASNPNEYDVLEQAVMNFYVKDQIIST